MVGSVVLVVVAGLVGVVLARASSALPATTLATTLPRSVTVAGTSVAEPWPAGTEGAVAVPSLGYATQSGPEVSVPVASLTKMTTAVQVLRDHPIAPGSDGPTITVTADDAAMYGTDVTSDQSSVEVQAGETLTERQMLEALLVRSANNIAYALAVWDAGSEAAFVAKMNALARSLGMSGSHYVDSSGFEPQSVSTAADCLKMAAAGMAIPTFAQIVAMPSVTLPLVGTMPNYVTQVGQDGVIGVKSGFTSQAGGCLVLATERNVGGQQVLVLAAVTGVPVVNGVAMAEPITLQAAGTAASALLATTASALVPTTVVTAGHVVGHTSTRWGGGDHPVPVEATSGIELVGMPGQLVTISTAASGELAKGAGRRGQHVGMVTATLGTQQVTAPLRLSGDVPEPSWSWRALHG